MSIHYYSLVNHFTLMTQRTLQYTRNCSHLEHGVVYKLVVKWAMIERIIA